MRKIEFIAPVESMRGNLSGSQVLEYAENDNPAYEAPDGVQYAKNYDTRYIGARRARDGHTYFAVKQRSATLVSTSTKRTWAVLGGTQAVYGTIVKDGQIIATINSIYTWLKSHGLVDVSQRLWMQQIIREGLMRKSTTFLFAGGTGVGQVNIGNPWIYPSTYPSGTTKIHISSKVFIKFFPILAKNAIEYTIDGVGTAPAWSNLDWQEIIESGENNVPELNVFGLTFGGTGDDRVVMYGELYLLKAAGSYAAFDDEIAAQTYTLTETPPSE